MAESDSRTDALVEEGLLLYSQGKLDAALEKWRAVLKITADHARAREYLKYVEDNRAALEESFRVAPKEKTPTPPLPTARGWALETMETTEGPTRGRRPSGATSARRRDSFPSESTPSGRTTLLGTPTPPKPTPLVRNRHDTPLRVVAGGNQPAVEDFDPQEETPVGVVIPQPVRVVSDEVPELPRAPSASEPELTWEASSLESWPPVAQPGPEASPSPAGAPSAGDPQDAAPWDREAYIELDIKDRGLTPAGRPPSISSGTWRAVARAGLSGEPPQRRKRTISGQGEKPIRAPGGGPLAPAGAGALGAGEPAMPDEPARAEVQRTPSSAGHCTLDDALKVLEDALVKNPSSVEVRRMLESKRKLLLQRLREQLSELGDVPVIQVPQHEIVWQHLDHRAGFLLSRIDGLLTIDDILDISGMGQLEACRILVQLMAQGVIGAKR